MKEAVIRIMLEAGNKGISLRFLVLHVYNASNSLFHSVTKEEVREYVYNLVRNHSTLPTDPFERIGWGRYRINLRSQKVVQSYIDLMVSKMDARLRNKDVESLVSMILLFLKGIESHWK